MIAEARCIALSLALCGAASADAPLELREIAADVYVAVGPHEEANAANLGGIANVGIVVGSRSVAVIDTGGSLAFGRRLRASVRAVTALPVSHVINTHGHPDHVFGNAAFDDGTTRFVGHHKLERALATRAPFYLDAYRRLLGPAFEGTAVVAPDIAVREALEIDLGDRRLRLLAFPTAHTDNDLAVLDLRTGTLFAGDLLFMERLPVVDGSIKGWIAALDALRGIDAERVVPGHGPASAAWPEALAAEERYLQTVLQGVRREIAAGGTIQSAVEAVGGGERERWLLFRDNHPRNVTSSFTELEWE